MMKRASASLDEVVVVILNACLCARSEGEVTKDVSSGVWSMSRGRSVSGVIDEAANCALVVDACKFLFLSLR